MRKLSLIVAAILISLSSFAQEAEEQKEAPKKTNEKSDSPTMWIGGAVTTGLLADAGKYDYTIAPNWGMMFSENMGFGVALDYSGGNNNSLWLIEPYFRYYLPIIKNFSFYGDAFVGFGGKDPDTTVDDDESSNLDFGGRIGLQYWFTPKWSIAASSDVLRYESETDKNGNSKDDFGFGVDFRQVNFSFFYHF